ncbi:hypothetical protein [Mesobacillus foraminis]|nr:hypothetical protein [Mesobacillus foraminis]
MKLEEGEEMMEKVALVIRVSLLTVLVYIAYKLHDIADLLQELIIQGKL